MNLNKGDAMGYRNIRKIAMTALLFFLSMILIPNELIAQESYHKGNYLHQAKYYYDEGDYDKAIELLKILIEENQKNNTPKNEVLIEAYYLQAKIFSVDEKYRAEMETALKNIFKYDINYIIPDERNNDNLIREAERIRKIIKTETVHVIENPRSDVIKKKKFPWLMVIGGVIVLAALIKLILTKKPNRTLTVSVGEGVEGIPVSGTSSHKNGTTVSYNYTIKTGYTGLVVKIDGNEVAASGSIKMDANHTLTATATKRYTLTVTRGAGVDGTPISGSTQYNSGETVSYNYTLQSGYKDMVVKLDGLEVSPSGTIVMDKDHTLTATAGKTYRLTVTKGTGVIGLPDTGTFYYKDGETLNYSYSLQSGYADLELKLDGNMVTASGVITMDQDHNLVVSTGKTYCLTTSVNVGVDGSPQSGTMNYPAGTTVNYSYSLNQDYKNLLVTLDGNPVPASGIITMDADRTLIAAASGVNKFTLSVTVGTGVQGNPVQGITQYSDGDKIDYAYSLKNGYTKLIVTLDQNLVSASGSIMINKDLVLVASATK